MQKYSPRQEICGTCNHWRGMRILDEKKSVYVRPEAKGICALTKKINAQDVACGELARWAFAHGDQPYLEEGNYWEYAVCGFADGEPNSSRYNPGTLHYEGQNSDHDSVETVDWYEPASTHEVATAQFNLGLKYYEGQGVAQDYAEAIKWFRLAARRGNAKAQCNLGFMYCIGEGVAQDYVRAHMWLSFGALSGDSEAVKTRDLVEMLMTPQQIAQAQAMVRDCQRLDFNGCDRESNS